MAIAVPPSFFDSGQERTLIHPRNADQIEQMTGRREQQLPAGFDDEYMEQLRMFHRVNSSGGPLPIELLILILREFEIGGPTEEIREANKTRWAEQPKGVKVLLNKGGFDKKAIFVGVISGGTIGVQLDGEERVIEVRPSTVKLDRSIPSDINQGSLVDDYTDTASAKQVELLDELPIHWQDIKPAQPVSVDGKAGAYVGSTPDNPEEVTVEIDGYFHSVDKAQVTLQKTPR